MNPIEMLEQEHEQIERELVELEAISEAEEVNYSNLIHVFNRLCPIWNEHEEKEEKIFPIMAKEKIKVPVEKMLCEHKELREYEKSILKAIDSGSNHEMKSVLNNECKIVIEKLRKHIKDEDEVLYTIALSEFTSEEIQKLWNSVK